MFFSFAGLFHRYYLEMLAPAIAALAGAGVAAMWRAYNQHRWRGLILPFAILITALGQAATLLHFPDWGKWLIPTILAMALLGIAGLMIARFVLILRLSTFGFCLLTLLIVPTTWSITPLLGADAGLPFAGPELAMRPQRGANLPSENRLLEFLRANRRDEKFMAATLNAQAAAPIILATGEPVMALGGFSGSDPILSAEELAARVAGGEVRFFLLPPDTGQQVELTRWVKEHCGRASFQLRHPGQPELYDCARK